MISKNTLLLLCVSIPSFMINLDANIVAVSLTSIAHSLHADFAAIEWVISGYTLAFAILLMPAGALADRFGRKRMLLIGLALFTIASGICGAASTSLVLNAARVLQGTGAALQLSAALAILAHGFHGAARAKAFAFWGSVIGIATTLGPVVGGLITQSLGWQWAFYINLPIGCVMIALVLHTVTDSKDPNANKIDTAGVITLSAGLGLLTSALIAGNRDGWSSLPIMLQLVGSAVFFIAFLIVELKQKRPMVELHYFLRPTYLGATIAGVAYAVSFLTLLTYLPLFFQSGLGKSPLIAGLLMLPLAIPLFIMPRIVSSYLDHRWSGRTLLSSGLILVGIGAFFTALHIREFQYLTILWSMMIASVGAGILNGQTAKVGMSVIPIERAGMASGIAGTMRFSGVVVGFAALGAILYERISIIVSRDLPMTTALEKGQIIHSIVNGNLQAANAFISAHQGLSSVASDSIGFAYQGVFFMSSLVALVAGAAVWLLVKSHETAPIAVGMPQPREEISLD